jgi:hypothetical protein
VGGAVAGTNGAFELALCHVAVKSLTLYAASLTA